VAQSWWSIREDKTLTLADAQQHSYFTVRILEEHASRALNEAMRAMNAAGDEIRLLESSSPSYDAMVQRILLNQRQESQFIYALSVFDRDGKRQLSSRPHELPGSNAVAPGHIGVLLKQTLKKEVVVGAATRLENSDQWILPIASNFYDEKGALQGMLEVDVRLSYFQDFYEIVARGGAAAISLHNQRGNILARAPFDSNFLDHPVTQTDLLLAITDPITEGSLVGNGLIDGGGEYLYTYRKITGIPLTLVYARNMDSILLDWKNRLQQRIMFTSLTVAFIVMLALMLMWQLKRLQISKAKFIASENRYRILFTGAQDAILIINRDYIYVDCNHAAVHLLGAKSQADIIGKRVGGFSAPHQTIIGLKESDKEQLIIFLIDQAFAGVAQCFEWQLEKMVCRFTAKYLLVPWKSMAKSYCSVLSATSIPENIPSAYSKDKIDFYN